MVVKNFFGLRNTTATDQVGKASFFSRLKSKTSTSESNFSAGKAASSTSDSIALRSHKYAIFKSFLSPSNVFSKQSNYYERMREEKDLASRPSHAYKNMVEAEPKPNPLAGYPYPGKARGINATLNILQKNLQRAGTELPTDEDAATEMPVTLPKADIPITPHGVLDAQESASSFTDSSSDSGFSSPEEPASPYYGFTSRLSMDSEEDIPTADPVNENMPTFEQARDNISPDESAEEEIPIAYPVDDTSNAVQQVSAEKIPVPLARKERKVQFNDNVYCDDKTVRPIDTSLKKWNAQVAAARKMDSSNQT